LGTALRAARVSDVRRDRGGAGMSDASAHLVASVAVALVSGGVWFGVGLALGGVVG